MICSDISAMDHRSEKSQIFFLYCAIYEQDIVLEVFDTPLKIVLLLLLLFAGVLFAVGHVLLR